jgi:hypothetical protein
MISLYTHIGTSLWYVVNMLDASFRFEPPTLGILFKCDSAIVSERPTQFKKVAQIDRKGSDEILFFWYPVPPPGYASLGCVATKTDEMPSNDSVCCPKMGLVNHANILEDPISRSSSSKGPNCWSIWKVSNQVIHYTCIILTYVIIGTQSICCVFRAALSWQHLIRKNHQLKWHTE